MKELCQLKKIMRILLRLARHFWLEKDLVHLNNMLTINLNLGLYHNMHYGDISKFMDEKMSNLD